MFVFQAAKLLRSRGFSLTTFFNSGSFFFCGFLHTRCLFGSFRLSGSCSFCGLCGNGSRCSFLLSFRSRFDGREFSEARVIDGLFRLHPSSECRFRFTGEFSDFRSHFVVLFTHPRFELLLSFRFGEGAFFYAVEEVIVVHDALVLHQSTRGVRHFSAHLQPMQRTVVIEVDGRRIRVRVVRADFFDETAVARSAGVCGYDVVEGLALFTVALKAEASCHVRNVLEGS